MSQEQNDTNGGGAQNSNTETDESFSSLKVSTTTVTASFPCSVNIIDLAKYLQLDDIIIGIKLVYAGGNSSIVRGVAKISTKAKDFYNQVTFTVRLPLRNQINKTILVSCKLFHNGTLHVTGTHDLEEASDTVNLLYNKIANFKGLKIVKIRETLPFLSSYDNLIYASHGDVIGWIDPSSLYTNIISTANRSGRNKNDKSHIYIKNEYVILEKLNDNVFSINSDEDFKDSLEPFYVFISNKWTDNCKRIYSLDGDYIGSKKLIFDLDISRRHFEVKFGYIYSGNKIVGKEVVELVDCFMESIKLSHQYSQYLLQQSSLVHIMNTFPQNDCAPASDKVFTSEDFNVYMINMFFKSPFKICRKRLHKKFLDQGYYSRFDPCSHAAVNLRFHYNELTLNDHTTCGKCVNKVLNRSCNCKDISVSCFNSGKMNITGLATVNQGVHVYEFIKSFCLQHKREIMSDSDSSIL